MLLALSYGSSTTLFIGLPFNALLKPQRPAGAGWGCHDSAFNAGAEHGHDLLVPRARGARCLPDGRHRSIEATAQTDSFPIPICCSEIFCLFFLLRKEATSYSDKKGWEKSNIGILHNDFGSSVLNMAFWSKQQGQNLIGLILLKAALVSWPDLSRGWKSLAARLVQALWGWTCLGAGIVQKLWSVSGPDLSQGLNCPKL